MCGRSPALQCLRIFTTILAIAAFRAHNGLQSALDTFQHTIENQWRHALRYGVMDKLVDTRFMIADPNMDIYDGPGQPVILNARSFQPTLAVVEPDEELLQLVRKVYPGRDPHTLAAINGGRIGKVNIDEHTMSRDWQPQPFTGMTVEIIERN